MNTLQPGYYPITQTPEYLLILDHTQLPIVEEIGFLDWHGNFNAEDIRFGIVTDYNDKHFFLRNQFDNVSGASIDDLKKDFPKHRKGRILAHLPLNGAPALQGVPLLPEPPEQHYTLKQMRDSFYAGYSLSQDEFYDRRKTVSFGKFMESLEILPVAFKAKFQFRKVSDTELEEVPIISSDSKGRTLWQGVYIYETRNPNLPTP